MYSNMLLELKKMVVILEYFTKDVGNATTFVGVAYFDGPPFLDKTQVPPFHSLYELEKLQLSRTCIYPTSS
jgi:hypothetical protein